MLLRRLNFQLIITAKTIDIFHAIFFLCFCLHANRSELLICVIVLPTSRRRVLLLASVGKGRDLQNKYYSNMSESRGFLLLPQKAWHVGVEMTAAGRSHGIWFFSLHSLSRHGGFSSLGKCMDKAGSQSRSAEAQQNYCVLCCPKPVPKTRGEFWAI